MANVGSVNGKLQSTALATDGVCYADSSGLVQTTAVGTSTNVLTSNGAGNAPTFQAVSASGAVTTITGNSGGAESPSSGNFNVLGTGSITVAGSANTETVQLTGLTNHALQVGAGTATLTQLAVGSNGQVLIGATTADPAFATLSSSDSSVSFTTGANTLSLQVAGGSTTVKTITGNSGGAESPSSGNFNILGTGSITVAGTANTETVQLTGLTNHALQVGAGTATLTQLGAGTTGQVLQTNTGADPTWSTATYPSTTTANQLLYSSAANTVGGLTSGNSLLAATNASGTLAMRAFSLNVQTFTSTGTYTTTSGLLYSLIECVGGGGGGGGAATSTGQIAVAGGGGSGEYASGVFSASTLGSSVSITIGAAGTAGSAGNNAGGTGGTTSVGSTLISAVGGTGGAGAASGAVSNNNGGAGGTGGTGGSVRVAGAPGFGSAATASTGPAISGAGGSGRFGSGGASSNAAGAGANATGNGGGGAGAFTSNSSQQAGGAATKGMVIVTEYVIA